MEHLPGQTGVLAEIPTVSSPVAAWLRRCEATWLPGIALCLAAAAGLTLSVLGRALQATSLATPAAAIEALLPDLATAASAVAAAVAGAVLRAWRDGEPAHAVACGLWWGLCVLPVVVRLVGHAFALLPG